MPTLGRGNTWQVDSRLLDITVGAPDEPPTRPRLLMVLDITTRRILFAEFFHPQTPLVRMVETMAGKLPQEWPGERPGAIQVADPELAALLIGVYPPPATTIRVIRRLPELDRVVDELQTSLGQSGPSPAAYWERLESTYPDLSGLMRDAAAYYRARPWQVLDDDEIVEMTVAGRSRYLSVMGGAGRTYGLAVFMEKRGLKKLLRGDGGPESVPASVSVAFDEAREFAPALRRQLQERYPIAGRRAFPVFMSAKAGRAQVPPPDELDLLRMAMQTLPRLLPLCREPAPGTGWPLELQAEAVASRGTVSVTLRFPADFS